MDSDLFKGSGIDIYPKGLSGGSSSSSSNTNSSDRGHLNLGGKEHTISSWLPGSKSNVSSGGNAQEHYDKAREHANAAFRDCLTAGGLGVGAGVAASTGQPAIAGASTLGAAGSVGMAVHEREAARHEKSIGDSLSNRK